MTYLEKQTMMTYYVPDLMFAPYYGRKTNEKYNECFSGNYYYPNAEKATNIVLNLEVHRDENNQINYIDYYKVKYLSYGAGRPQTDTVSLTKTDFNKFAKVLDECTESPSYDALTELLLKAKESNDNCWQIFKENKNDIMFSDNKDTNIKIPKKFIVNCLDISYKYLEVLYSDIFWEANSSYLRSDYKEPVLALLSHVDYSKYPNINILQLEKQERIYKVESITGIERLASAAKDNNIELFYENVKYAKTKLYYGTNYHEPIFYAIENKNTEFVKALIENGAEVEIERGYYKEPKCLENWETPLSFAIRTECNEIANILFDVSNDIKLLEKAVAESIIIKNASFIIKLCEKGTNIFVNEIEGFSAEEDIRKLIGLKNVKWTKTYIEKAYLDRDTHSLNAMLVANQTKENIIYGDHRLDDINSEIMNWAISLMDLEFILFASNLGYKFDSSSEFINNCLSLSSEKIDKLPDVFQCAINKRKDEIKEEKLKAFSHILEDKYKMDNEKDLIYFLNNEPEAFTSSKKVSTILYYCVNNPEYKSYDYVYNKCLTYVKSEYEAWVETGKEMGYERFGGYWKNFMEYIFKTGEINTPFFVNVLNHILLLNDKEFDDRLDDLQRCFEYYDEYYKRIFYPLEHFSDEIKSIFIKLYEHANEIEESGNLEYSSGIMMYKSELEKIGLV